MLVRSKAKYIQSLSHKKQRDEDGVFVAEGPKIVNELLASRSAELIELYALPGILQSFAAQHPSKLVEVDHQSLEKISFLSTPNQVLGLFKRPPAQPFRPAGVSLLLDTIQDPGNLGTIIRSADWFGITQVICSTECADVYGPKTIQSTMGSIARVNVLYGNLEDVVVENPGVSSYAATLDGQSIYEVNFVTPSFVVIGNESKGIGVGLLSKIKNRITIPRRGEAESLNAAVATGIILSHIARS